MNDSRRRPAIAAILAGLLVATLMVFHPPAAGALPAPLEPLARSVPPPGETPTTAAPVDPEPATTVVEMLRLRVPAQARQAWLAAERECWDPWLRAQAGFLGRELLWDGERQEGVLLIRWATPELWHAIPQQEVDRVQRDFEEVARRALGQSAGQPFPLLSSSSLQPQGRT
jgi:uncharacterized protein (TIGR03792 family)